MPDSPRQKTLIIAEKPSVARDIATALGKVRKHEDWFENDDLVISSAIGHLVELNMPEDIDKKLRFWSLGSLPILPEPFTVKPIEKTKSKFSELKKLIARKDIGRVVNACDAGREGELIFAYIADAAGNKKPVSRMWMQSMTPAGIRAAYEDLRTEADLAPLRDAARCRSEADWLVGINGTRAITTRMFGRAKGKVATVGRVQTPTLALVVAREREIRAFVPRTYYRVVGTFGLHGGASYEGVYQRPDFRKAGDEHDRADRVWDRAEADALLARAAAGAGKGALAEVAEEKKRTTQVAPRLYDLTTLQREANNRYGFPANRTLQIAQALYEKHKVLTYPRTDSRALPEDYVAVMKDLLPKLPGDLGKFGREAVDQGHVRPNRRLFNNAEVSDHFAIVPTGVEPEGLDEGEAKLFDLVARRTVAAFYPAAEFDVTTRTSTVAGLPFRTEGKVLAVPGWLAVYGKDEQAKDSLPALGAQDVAPDGRPASRVLEMDLLEESTKPPARYTEATLLSAMETAGKLVDDEELAAAMKDKGLGTPATRAATIEHLLREKYMERDRRELLPTAKAEQLVDFLGALKVDVLTRPDLTGEWEHRLKQIEAGKLTRAEFMQGIRDLTTDLVGKAKSYNEAESEARTTAVVSPTDGQPMLETVRTYRSQDGALVIYKTIGNRLLAEEELGALLRDGQIGPLEGFRSKMGRPFTASLKLGEDRKVSFVFADRPAEDGGEGGAPVDPATLPVLGPCPKACAPGAQVREGSNAYACERQMAGEKGCTFRFSKTLLAKTIDRENALRLLGGEKTALIEGFKSKRTGRFFDAFLYLKKEGGLGFEFPPREKKEGAAKGGPRKPRSLKGKGRKVGAAGADEAPASPTVADEPF